MMIRGTHLSRCPLHPSPYLMWARAPHPKPPAPADLGRGKAGQSAGGARHPRYSFTAMGQQQDLFNENMRHFPPLLAPRIGFPCNPHLIYHQSIVRACRSSTMYTSPGDVNRTKLHSSAGRHFQTSKQRA